MAWYRRRLPHLYHIDVPVFVTWRLAGSLPAGRCFSTDAMTSGKAFVALDRLLDEGRSGPLYLRQPLVAKMLVEALHYHGTDLKHYDLHAFTVMPNHVHFPITPHIALPKIMKSLKGFTAKQANELLSLTGAPFWEQESYDHLVRDQREFARIRFYIEQNPVKAGLVAEPAGWPWCNAAEVESL